MFEQTESGRNAEGGTGLGLAISLRYAQIMGGEIIYSNLEAFSENTDNGSTFTLTFLADEVHASEIEDSGTEICGLTHGQVSPVILVVDDIDNNRSLARVMLEQAGFVVIDVCNGQQAIDCFNQCRLDLILMDIRMPVMGGLEAIRRIKATERGKMVPVIALTASAFEEERDGILSQGADDFLSKPFKRQMLLELIGRHLNLNYDYTQQSTEAFGVIAAPPANFNDDSNLRVSSPSGVKVLIVDDVRPNRMLLNKIMSAERYICREASNGIEALKVIESWQPDITLLDIQMPVMNGYEVLKHMKENPIENSIVVIAVTANEGKEEMVRLKLLGAAEVCSKPLDAEQIRRVVRRQLMYLTKHAGPI